jgi:hypothetical protein
VHGVAVDHERLVGHEDVIVVDYNPLELTGLLLEAG